MAQRPRVPEKFAAQDTVYFNQPSELDKSPLADQLRQALPPLVEQHGLGPFTVVEIRSAAAGFESWDFESNPQLLITVDANGNSINDGKPLSGDHYTKRRPR